MKHEQSFSKNITLKVGNIEVITGFMNKTKKNFSATVNIIVEEWDRFSIMMMKLKEEQETKKGMDHIGEIQKAKDFSIICKPEIKRVKK